MIHLRAFAPVRPVGKASGDLWWRALHRIADELEPDLRRAFLQAVRNLQARLDPANLELALQRNRLEDSPLWDALRSELDSALRAPVREAMLGGAGVAQRRLPIAGLRFDLTNPAAVQAVDRTVATLVQGLTEESRQGVRALVRESLQGRADVHELARQLGSTIGLTEPQTVAVARFEQRLLDQGTRPGRATRLSQAYADRLLRHRAETVARTEVIRASNAGQQAVWEQAQADGRIPPDAERVWIVTPDDRLCPLCAPMEGMTVSVNATFGRVPYPPLHPNCRCTMGLSLTP